MPHHAGQNLLPEREETVVGGEERSQQPPWGFSRFLRKDLLSCSRGAQPEREGARTAQCEALRSTATTRSLRRRGDSGLQVTCSSFDSCSPADRETLPLLSMNAEPFLKSSASYS